MSRYYLAALLLFLLVFEGTIMPNAISSTFQLDVTMVPRFLVIVIVFAGIFIGRTQSFIHGLIFGFIYDIVYTEFLGIYAFGFAFIGYMFALTTKRIQDSIAVTLLLSCLAVVFFEYYQFSILQMLGVTEWSGMKFAEQRLLPTVILNGAFAILALYPIRRLMNHINHQANLRRR